MNNTNRLSAFANIEDTANGLQARTRATLNNGTAVQNVFLSENLLRAMLRMNDQFGNIQINTIAGGNHTENLNDEHYRGVAADFQLNALGLAGRTPASILTFLESTAGFMTQRNSNGQSRNPNYHGNGTSMFHLEIWGRTGNNTNPPSNPATPVNGTTFRVSRTNTWVGSNPNAGHLGTLNTVGATLTRTAEAQRVVGNWTWVQGRLTGTVAQLGGIPNNSLVWIATSQLERTGTATTCTITDASNSGFTTIRNTPAGANAGSITNRTTTFRPTGDAVVSANGFNWRLGSISGTGGTFNGQTVWVATVQFAANSPCR
jgi:hypothetical protein